MKKNNWTELLDNELGFESRCSEIPKDSKCIADLCAEWGMAETTAYRHVKSMLKKGLLEKHMVKIGAFWRAYYTIKK